MTSRRKNLLVTRMTGHCSFSFESNGNGGGRGGGNGGGRRAQSAQMLPFTLCLSVWTIWPQFWQCICSMPTYFRCSRIQGKAVFQVQAYQIDKTFVFRNGMNSVST